MCRGCLARTHPCDATSRIMCRQSAKSCATVGAVTMLSSVGIGQRNQVCEVVDLRLSHYTPPRANHRAVTCGRSTGETAHLPRSQRSLFSSTRRDRLARSSLLWAASSLFDFQLLGEITGCVRVTATDLLSTSVSCSRCLDSRSLRRHRQLVPPFRRGSDLSWQQRSCHGLALKIKLTCGDP